MVILSHEIENGLAPFNTNPNFSQETRSVKSTTVLQLYIFFSSNLLILILRIMYSLDYCFLISLLKVSNDLHILQDLNPTNISSW